MSDTEKLKVAMKNPMAPTSAKVQRSSRWLVHCIAKCSDCEWDDDAYHTAARAASQHVRETGHKVAVDQGIVYFVSPKKKP